MKRIYIEVSNDYQVPYLFTSSSIAMKEVALTIGASAIDEVSKVKTINPLSDEKILLEKLKQYVEEATKISDSSREENRIKEAILTERERHLVEYRALEDKYQESVRRLEANHQETRRMLTLHEELVAKLMSRLEGGHRGGISSSTLGRTFEETVSRYFRQVFGARDGFAIEDVHTIGHSGDLIMTFDGMRILIELKSYDPRTKVPSKEVEKLARDLSEIQPPCNAGILISACSDITGHHSCGPLEVSSSVACVPVLFINNFLSLGEPQITLHMTRVFLAMIEQLSIKSEEPKYEKNDDRVILECSRRCTIYMSELSHQSSEINRQVLSLKNTVNKLRETVITLIDSEISRFGSLIKILSRNENMSPDVVLDSTVFNDQQIMKKEVSVLARLIITYFDIGDKTYKCQTKDLLEFIMEKSNYKTETHARSVIKQLFLETNIRHGYITGIRKKE